MPSLPFEIQEKILGMTIDVDIEEKIKELGFGFLYRQKVLEMETPWLYLVKREDLDTMKWLYSTNLKIWDAGVFDEAIATRNFEIISWLLEKDCPRGLGYSRNVLNSGDYELIGWFTVHDYVFRNGVCFLRPIKSACKVAVFAS
jgi:hypothetical protein